MKPFPRAWLGLVLCCAPVAAQLPSAPTDLPEPLRGSLIIVGGGAMPDSVTQAFLKLAGADQARIILIPTAGDAADQGDRQALTAVWEKRTNAPVHVLHPRDQ